jgi:hypothetical protein
MIPGGTVPSSREKNLELTAAIPLSPYEVYERPERLTDSNTLEGTYPTVIDKANSAKGGGLPDTKLHIPASIEYH